MGCGAEVSRLRLSVVIPTYNRGSLLLRCLKAFSNQTCSPSDYEILLVDDGSTEPLPDEIYDPKHWAPVAVRCIRQEENKGPAGARNLGIREAKGEIILFTGDDIHPDPDLVNQHLVMHQESPDAATAVLGQVKWSEQLRLTPVMRYLEQGQQFGYPLITDPSNAGFRFFYTSNLSLKRAFLLSHGLFDDSFPYALWEDIELGYRLEEKGLRIRYNPRALAYHNHPTTLESFCGRQHRSGQMALLFGLKHPECASWLDIPTALTFPRAIRESRLEKIKGFLKAEGVDEEVHESQVILGESTNLFRIRKELLDYLLPRLFRLCYLQGIADAYFSRGYYETLPLRVNKERVIPPLSHLRCWTLSSKYKAFTRYINQARAGKGYLLLLFSKAHLHFWKLLDRFFRGEEERRNRKATKLTNHAQKPGLIPAELVRLKQARRAIFFHFVALEVLEEVKRFLDRHCPDMVGVSLARRKRAEKAFPPAEAWPSLIYFNGVLDLFVHLIWLLWRKGRPDVIGIFYRTKYSPQNSDFLRRALILFLRPRFFLARTADGVALFKVESLMRLFSGLTKDFIGLSMTMALGIVTTILTCIILVGADLLRVLSRDSKEVKPS